ANLLPTSKPLFFINKTLTMKTGIAIARIFIKKAIERFSNLTKEDAVKFIQDIAADYAKEKLKNYLEEKIQGLLQDKDEKISEVVTKTPPITKIIKQTTSPFFEIIKP
nr:hypothetical protein [Tanacetum cinerariifolium]